MKACSVTTLASALLLSTVQTEARPITCPAAGSDEAGKSGETNWSSSYKGPLVSVQMRTEMTGERKGEAIIYCMRAIGAVSVTGRNCRLTPGAGGRVATKTEPDAEIVTCTLLGTGGTNDTACFVMCE